MRNTILITLTAATLGTGAFAQSVNGGQAQLAAQLGLDAGSYSLSDLVKIDASRRDDGTDALVGTTGADTLANVSGGKAQIAAQLGLDAADYTLAELVTIADARAEGDAEGAAFYAAKGNRAGVNPVGNAGFEQIAAQYGVSTADTGAGALVALTAND